MARNHPWRRHAGHLALPTLALAGTVVVGELVLWAAVLSDALPLWAGALIATLLAYLAFTPMHDASHGAVGGRASRSWLDGLTGHTMGLVLCAPYALFRSIHLRHHGATNHPERDPDHWVQGATAVGTAARCLTIVPFYYWVAVRELMLPRSSFRRALPKALAGLGAQLVLGGVLLGLGLGPELVVLWVGPAILASGVLAFLFDWLPHHDTVQGRGKDTRLLLLPGLALPMLNQHLHLVHHLYPRVPFYRYGTLFSEISDELQDAPVVGGAPA